MLYQMVYTCINAQQKVAAKRCPRVVGGTAAAEGLQRYYQSVEQAAARQNNELVLAF